MKLSLSSWKPAATQLETEMTDLTETQKNFIQRAVESHSQIILEEIMGVPDENPRVPDWAQAEIFDLLKHLDD